MTELCDFLLQLKPSPFCYSVASAASKRAGVGPVVRADIAAGMQPRVFSSALSSNCVVRSASAHLLSGVLDLLGLKMSPALHLHTLDTAFSWVRPNIESEFRKLNIGNSIYWQVHTPAVAERLHAARHLPERTPIERLLAERSLSERYIPLCHVNALTPNRSWICDSDLRGTLKVPPGGPLDFRKVSSNPPHQLERHSWITVSMADVWVTAEGPFPC